MGRGVRTGNSGPKRQSPRAAVPNVSGVTPASGERSYSTLRFTATPSARQRGQPAKRRGSSKRARQRRHDSPTTRASAPMAGASVGTASGPVKRAPVIAVPRCSLGQGMRRVRAGPTLLLDRVESPRRTLVYSIIRRRSYELAHTGTLKQAVQQVGGVVSRHVAPSSGGIGAF